MPLRKSENMMFLKLFGTGISRLAERESHRQAAYRWKHFYRHKIENLPKKYDVALAYTSGEIMFFVKDKVDAAKKYVWVHNDYRTGLHPKEYDKPYFREMDGIVSISKQCVDILKEEFPEFSDKIYYIENITSSKVIKKRADEFCPKEFSHDTVNILSVGRLMNQKGFDMAISAAAILKRAGFNFKWYIIGNGVLQKKLEQQIHQEHVEDCLILLGPKGNPYPYIKNCTIFAQTSRWEGKSVVLDEAKILGRPILATSYPTVFDEVNDGKEGIIVPMNPEGIAEGLKKLISDEQLRNTLSKFLQDHEYGNQEEVEKYVQLIER